jgi:hypothetical protein
MKIQYKNWDKESTYKNQVSIVDRIILAELSKKEIDIITISMCTIITQK